MELIDVTPEIRRLFLEQVADEYKIFGKERILFLCRFDYPNKKCKDTEIFEQLKIDKSLVSTPRKNLTSIYNKLGFTRTKNGRGASPKGESPFNKASDWLWIEKFNEWLKLQQNPNIQTPILNDDEWLKVCHTKLEDQQQEQQRIRRKGSEMGFELNVHVPLGLLERKQQQRRDGNVDRSEVNKLEKEVIVKSYEHNDFLEQVINQNSAGKNKHIAIVGEAGAGKTTLLSAIASHIKQENKDLPIFISLGSLEGMTLEQYLLKKWLPDAMRLSNLILTSELEEQLKSRFYQDDFWLLLDGVDEMGKSSPIEALNKISQELTNWLGQARVVLTCRLNVWDASLNNNILSGFDTYKTQEFEPEQVDKFIEQWFKCDENKIQRGEELKAKLREPGKERIRELVTNPLRLSLLCQIFYQNQHSDLPETTAELFGLYTQYFYDWKSTPETQELRDSHDLQKELHQALGKLALAGINSDARFRMNKSLVVEVMTERLFKLARDVGWLNLVDRDIYAFFHPNFQEYFAALVIDDWRYFLNHVSNNPDKGTYRIFETRWKEVYLLWLGINSVDKNQKEALIYELSIFEDECSGIYQYKAYYLAAIGLKEFKSKFAEQFISWLINVGFGDTQEWQIDHYNRAEIARELLLITDNYLASNLVVQLAQNTNVEFILRICASILGQIGKDHQGAIATLISLISNSTPNRQSIISLGYIAKENKEAISVLRNLIKTVTDNYIKYLAATSLLKISSIYKTEAIDTLLKLMRHHHNDFSRCNAAYYLAKLDYYYFDEAIDNLIKMQKSEDKFLVIQSELYLSELNCNNSNHLPSNNHLLEVDSEYPDSVDELINVICNYTDYEHIDSEACDSASDKLVEILTNNENCKTVVKTLKYKLSPDIEEKDFTLYYNCYKVIWHCAQNMTYPEFYRAWHGEPSPIQNLENQFTDTHPHLTQLQPTEKTYPLTLNLKTLQNETDISAIAQKICNQIYPRFFDENLEIPQVNNAPQLERIILQFRNYLKKENIALIINNCEPNQEMIKFCNKLTDVLHIAFITEQPLDAPLKGFPNQPNLLNVIQHWINEIQCRNYLPWSHRPDKSDYTKLIFLGV